MIWNIFVALEMTFDISLSKIFLKISLTTKYTLPTIQTVTFYKDVEKNMCVNKSYKHRHKSNGCCKKSIKCQFLHIVICVIHVCSVHVDFFLKIKCLKNG